MRLYDDGRRRRRACAPLLLLPALVAACARPPAALRGEYAPTTVEEARVQPSIGERVRWGGELVRATPGADGRTCFELVAKPLDRTARPLPSDEPAGRFLACAAGYYDPATWAPGREVTAVGTIDGTVVAKVGDYDYRYPRLRADAVHLWPEPSAGPRAYWPWVHGGGASVDGGGSWSVGVGIGF